MKGKTIIAIVISTISVVSIMGVVGVKIIHSAWEKFKIEQQVKREERMEKLQQTIDERNAERGEIIKKSLEEKYGEPFVINYVGRNTNVMLAGDIMATCYPVADPTLKFRAMLDLDTQEVKDKYLCVVVGRNEETVIGEYVKTLWEESRIFVYNDSGIVYPDAVDKEIRHEAFIKLYPGSCQLVRIHVKGPDIPQKINQEEEIEKYKALADWLVENKYFKTDVSVVYVQDEAYERYQEIKERKPTQSYFWQEGEVMARIGVRIDKNGDVDKSTEGFKENFAVWIKE